MVAGEDQHIVRLIALDEANVLIDGVGRALVPFGALCSWHRAAGPVRRRAMRSRSHGCPVADVLVQHERLILGKHADRIEFPKLTQLESGKVYDSVFAAERHRGLRRSSRSVRKGGCPARRPEASRRIRFFLSTLSILPSLDLPGMCRSALFPEPRPLSDSLADLFDYECAAAAGHLLLRGICVRRSYRAGRRERSRSVTSSVPPKFISVRAEHDLVLPACGRGDGKRIVRSSGSARSSARRSPRVRAALDSADSDHDRVGRWSIGVYPLEAVPVRVVDLHKARVPQGRSCVQHVGRSSCIWRVVVGSSSSEPVKALREVPFDELRELVAHEV